MKERGLRSHVIVLAVRWYLPYGLSYRDVEDLLAERGIEVDHVTIYRWVQRFTPLLVDAARPCRHVVGDRWFVDETYVKAAGVWRYVYRAVDQFGQVIDVYVSRRRDLAAARRFFAVALGDHGRPAEVVISIGDAGNGEEFPLVIHPLSGGDVPAGRNSSVCRREGPSRCGTREPRRAGRRPRCGRR